MKTLRLFICIVAMLASNIILAQTEYMQILQNDGTITNVKVSDIKRVTFITVEGDEENGSLVGTWEVISITKAFDDKICPGAMITLNPDGRLVAPGREDCEGDCWKVEDNDKLLINLSEHWGIYDDGLYGTFCLNEDIVTYNYNMWNNPDRINKDPASFKDTLILKRVSTSHTY